MEEVYNKEHFYSYLVYSDMSMLTYEKPLKPSHLQPIENVLLCGKELTPFSHELLSYQEARKCALDFDIYTLSANNEEYPLVVDLVMDCYRLAAKEGVVEAYNNIGVFYVMTERPEKAIPYLQRAAEAGLATGLSNMMGYYGSINDFEKMMECVEKLAAMGDASGMWNYAIAYHFGYIGRKKDIQKAKKMYQLMMSLALKDDTKLSDDTETRLLELKAMACYNLAMIRYVSEERSEKNLHDIINLLEETPYVNISNTKIQKLKEEIFHSYGVDYKYK